MIDAFLFEEQGAGWVGGYYAITPLNHSVPAGFDGIHRPVKSATVVHVNAASAGTLEWTFGANRSVCIPLGDYGDSTGSAPHTHYAAKSLSESESSLSLSESLSESELDLNADAELEAKKAYLEHAPVCHSIQLSVPTLLLPVFPVFLFTNAWNIPKGKTYLSEGRLILIDVMFDGKI